MEEFSASLNNEIEALAINECAQCHLGMAEDEAEHWHQSLPWEEKLVRYFDAAYNSLKASPMFRPIEVKLKEQFFLGLIRQHVSDADVIRQLFLGETQVGDISSTTDGYFFFKLFFQNSFFIEMWS